MHLLNQAAEQWVQYQRLVSRSRVQDLISMMIHGCTTFRADHRLHRDLLRIQVRLAPARSAEPSPSR